MADHNDCAREPLGICCPKCGNRYFRVTDTRKRPGDIKRRRRCRACGKIVYTVEQTFADANRRKST